MFGGDNKNETRNLILAAVLSMAVVFAWSAFLAPAPPPPGEQTATGEAAQSVEGTAGGGTDQPLVELDRDGALAQVERIPIKSDAVSGSISLRGGRIDDLHLLDYRETLDPGSDTVTLLNPTGGPSPYFAVYGWLRAAGAETGPLPDANTVWELEDGATLTPDRPVVLRWDNGEGLIFRRRIEIDERFLLDVTQSVENAGGEAVSLAPYGYIARRGTPETTGFFILHEGVVAVFDGKLQEVSYGDMADLPMQPLEGGRVGANEVAENGWLGFTDKYWMTTLAPQPGQAFTAIYKLVPGALDEYRTEMRLPVMTVGAGESASVGTMLFAGAKEVSTIREYQRERGIERFEDSVDWGWFYFLTKPMFFLLASVHGLIGNMGFSIIVLTLIVKAILFPLAYKSYVAMSRMKKLQPEMEKIKERAGDDRMKLQQEIMALYKKEKVNPASGCLPILVQIPIFFALYKVLFVAIEMRHAPFIGWIRDLSAPDPTSWINLFGLLPYDVSWAPVFISIGVFPILLGVTMWMQQKLNPMPTDPTQQMIFAWMPWVFMFMLGSFASGLVVYWTANNVLTFIQQYAIMRSQGVQVDFFGNVTRSLKRVKPTGKVAPVAPSDKSVPGAGTDPAEITLVEDTGAPEAKESGEAPAEDGTPKPAGEAETERRKPKKAQPARRRRR